MNKLIVLLGLSAITNNAFASGNVVGFLLAAFSIVLIMQIIITVLDYKFNGKDKKGSLLLNVLFFAGFFIFNLVMTILENQQTRFSGSIYVVLILSIFVFPLFAKTIIVSVMKKYKHK